MCACPPLGDHFLQVPRSCRRVAEDADYVLMSVVLFRRTVDDFKTAARVRGFQVGLCGFFGGGRGGQKLASLPQASLA